jgi:hypothetical protein
VKRAALSVLALIVVGLTVAACNGTTGDELVSFNAYAAGAKGAGEPFSIGGYTVQLTYAQMYVGAVYVNEAPPGSGGTFNSPVCIDPGIYCAQVPGGLEVNLLDPSPQPFPVQGNGSADLGLSWEVYLVDGDVNDPENTGFGIPDTADLLGTATRESDGTVYSWFATVTINQENRGLPTEDPGQPGLNPICKQRILELGDISLTLAQGVSMLLTIDPRGWFKTPIDFSSLPAVATDQCGLDTTSMVGTAQYCIPDSSNLSGGVLGAQQGAQLYTGLFTAGGASYTLSYVSSP